jgi:L-arabinose isomerase
MGYRDMLLYGTQYEGNSMRGQIGVEVEPFEMLEMMQNIEKIDEKDIKSGVEFVKKSWKFEKDCDDAIITSGVKYALAVGKKIKERGYEAVTLIDVDGMKKLLGFPPAMVFMLLEHYYGVQIIPENDVMGAVTQLMLTFITGQQIPYLEYYEFFEKSVLIGVPDFIPAAVTSGDVKMLPAAFGLLSASLLNVSAVRTGQVTCARLVYKKGKYYMHLYTGNAESPPDWAECGWAAPAPQLPSLEITPDSCTVEEFAQKVSSQHVLVCYGDHGETIKDLCGLLDITVL